jgi:hypothetical protein
LGENGYRYYEKLVSTYTPEQWIKLFDKRQVKPDRVNTKSGSVLLNLIYRSTEFALRLLSLPLAVLVYGILALPVKVKRGERFSSFGRNDLDKIAAGKSGRQIQ